MRRMSIEHNWWNSLPYHNRMREQQKTEGEYVDVSTFIHQRSSIIHRHQRTLFLGDVQRHIVRAFEQVQDERIREKLQYNNMKPWAWFEVDPTGVGCSRLGFSSTWVDSISNTWLSSIIVEQSDCDRTLCVCNGRCSMETSPSSIASVNK